MREFQYTALPQALPEVYGELVSIAEAWGRRERGPQALEPTALVHETWLRLQGQALPPLDGPSHLLALATREMRRVRIDHGRAMRAAKRGGRLRQVDLPEEVEDREHVSPDGEVARALERLAHHRPRWRRVIELRWGLGWTVERVAAELGLSPATIEKDSRLLRLWLDRELGLGG
jgi:RNA polymerase sigma factor (TIGR02999 family)